MKKFVRFIVAAVIGMFASAALHAAGNIKVTLNPVTAGSAGARWRVDGGSWQTSGTTLKGLNAGSHTVDFNSVSGLISPSSINTTVVNGSTTTLSATYTQAASISISLTPATGQWRIDGGAWQSGRAMVSNLAPGNHGIEYLSLSYYQSPPNETVTLTAGQTLALQRNYTQLSQITIGLSPSTGQWRSNGGAWQASGASLWVPAGTYNIDYSPLDSYDAPAAEAVTFSTPGSVFATTRYYTPSNGSLHLDLTPAQAQWRVDGGAWQSSGTTLTLSHGDHTVDYSSVVGYAIQGSETVTIVGGQSLSYSRTYTQLGQISITLNPAAAQWRVDGGSWFASGAISQYLAPGNHTVDYAALSGYISPASESATVTGGQVLTLTRSYIQRPQITITLSPSSAQWRIDGGNWLASGATASNLTEGSHTIDYSALAGYGAPPSESVTLANGQPISLNRTYTQLAQVSVTLTPSNAQWRVDGGTWLASGATSGYLTPGAHTIDYSAVAGYTAPNSESVTVAAGQSMGLNRAYVQEAQLTVTLTPSNAQWRIDGGAWQASGTAVTNLAPTTHTIDYASLTNYDAPASESITLSPGQNLALTRAYSAHPAELTLTTNPANGQWRIYPDQTPPAGTWNASGATVTGIAPGAYDIQYSSLQGYMPPGTNYIVLQAGEARSITATYNTIAPELTVVLSPSSAQFRVNGSAWYSSGTTVKNLSAGTALVEFSDVTGYTKPAAMSVSLAWGDKKTISAPYTALPASLAVSATAPFVMWRIDGGQWRTTGITVWGLSAGGHVVEGWDVHGYTTPAPQTVTLIGGQTTNVSLNYVPHPAQLTVITNPSSGQWQIYPAETPAGTVWNNSGATVNNISPGTYTISYTSITGLASPKTTSVTLAPGDVKALSVSYTALTAQINVALNQTAGQWRLDGGSWQSTGATLANLPPGDHLLEFAALDGFSTPPPHTITLNEGDSINYAFRYLPSTPGLFRMDLIPMNANWRIDGGAWLPSGTTVGSLTDGEHTVEFSDLPGRQTPFSISVLPSDTGTTQYTRTYGQIESAGFNIVTSPSSGGYRINGWGWFASGSGTTAEAGVPTLVEYEPLPGYATPHSEFLVHPAPANQWVTVNRTYQSSVGATVSVGLNIPIGSWRIYSGAPAGAWQTNSGTVTGLVPGTYTIEYGAVADYASPSAETVTLIDHEDLVLHRTYTAFPAQVTVNVVGTPSGAQWVLTPVSDPTSGAWYNSGETATNLPPGDYTISYGWVQDYTAPWSEQITLNANQVVVRTGKYHHVYDISVATYPYTAKWRVDGGDWNNSGEGVWGIAPGDHTIEYGPAAGYITPPAETVTFSGQQIELFRNYRELAHLTAYLYPYAAQWRIDGGAWQENGTTVDNVTLDVAHTIEYSSVEGYVTPSAETVTLYSGQHQTLYKWYTPLPTLTINLSPDTGQWRVDGGSWQNSSATLIGLAPDIPHTIEYAPLSGGQAPPTETITLSYGQNQTLYRAYTPIP